MTNQEFIKIEKMFFRDGALLSPREQELVMHHARELQQKVFCGDVFARSIEKFLSDYDGDIPNQLQWDFGNYVCNEPKTKLNEMEITHGIGDTDTPRHCPP